MAQIDPIAYVLYKLRTAAVHDYPFPHFYVENVFTDDFYAALLAEVRAFHNYTTVEGRYAGRAFRKTEDISLLNGMRTRDFLASVCAVFAPHMKARFTDHKCVVYNDLRLVRDGRNYQIGPHTDAPWKVVSLLFYLPPDTWNIEHGTSLYVPNDAVFRCPGGPHHAFNLFKRVYTAPFAPNSCLGFFKTDNSFHGVEPIERDIQRDVLLYNVYSRYEYDACHKPHDAPTDAET